MSDDPEVPDKPDGANEEETSPDGEGAAEAAPGLSGSVPSLDAFASIQRMLASIDFSAIRAAQRAIEGTGKFKKDRRGAGRDREELRALARLLPHRRNL